LKSKCVFQISCGWVWCFDKTLKSQCLYYARGRCQFIFESKNDYCNHQTIQPHLIKFIKHMSINSNIPPQNPNSHFHYNTFIHLRN
jgi:hypothetical protein